MRNIIGLISPRSARHHRSKMLCNNPDVIIANLRPMHTNPNWYMGEFIPLKDVDIFKANIQYNICGFRPRRIAK